MRRSYGRFLMVFCIFVMLFALSSVSHATVVDNTQLATELKEMGLFNGTDKGFELDQIPTRAQTAVMLVNLLGASDEATSKKYTHPFTDVPSWANDYVGYMYQKGLTRGISETMFGSANNAKAKDFSTFMVKALGYTDNDFTYNDVLSFAQAKGLISLSEMNSLNTSTFTRNEMVLLAYNALEVPYKGSEKRLIDQLVDAKAVSVNVANKLDYYDYPTFPLEITAGNGSELYFKALYDQMDPDIYNRLLMRKDMGSNSAIDVSTTEKLARRLFLSDFDKEELVWLAENNWFVNREERYRKTDYEVNSFIGKDLEVAYYYEFPRNLSVGTYDIAMIKPSTELEQRLKELTVEYEDFYKEKMKSLIRLTPEMFEIITDEKGASYIQFNKDKMPDELSGFTHVSIGTIGPSSIDYDLLLKNEFAVLGSKSRNGLYNYTGDPIRLTNIGNSMMGLYDDTMNLIGTGFFVFD
jgi:hypothetical protein